MALPSALGCERRGWTGEDLRDRLRYDCRREEMRLRDPPLPEGELDPQAGVDSPRPDDGRRQKLRLGLRARARSERDLGP